MALTPEEVLNKQFTVTQFRKGYDEREVDDFLDDVVAEMRRQIKENGEIYKQLEECRGGRAAAPVARPGGDEADIDLRRLESRNKELEKVARQFEERLHGCEVARGDLQSRYDMAVKELERMRVATGAGMPAARASGPGAGQVAAVEADARARIESANRQADEAEESARRRILTAQQQADQAEVTSRERIQAAQRQVMEAEAAASRAPTPATPAPAAQAFGGLDSGTAASFQALVDSESGGGAAGVLALAQKLHDEHVAAGEAKRDELIATATSQRDAILSAATSRRDEMLTEARERSTGMVAEAQQQKATVLTELNREKERIEARIEELKSFERKYRLALKGYIEEQLGELDHTAVELPMPTDGSTLR